MSDSEPKPKPEKDKIACFAKDLARELGGKEDFLMTLTFADDTLPPPTTDPIHCSNDIEEGAGECQVYKVAEGIYRIICI